MEAVTKYGKIECKAFAEGERGTFLYDEKYPSEDATPIGYIPNGELRYIGPDNNE